LRELAGQRKKEEAEEEKEEEKEKKKQTRLGSQGKKKISFQPGS